MISEATLSPLEIAQELRPTILRLARNLRRDSGAFGVTAHQATLLAQVWSRPGLSLRELAESEGISPPSLSGSRWITAICYSHPWPGISF